MSETGYLWLGTKKCFFCKCFHIHNFFLKYVPYIWHCNSLNVFFSTWINKRIVIWKKMVRTDFEAITLKSVLARYFKKKFQYHLTRKKCKYFSILVLKELKIYLIYGNCFSYNQIIFFDIISPKSERIWCSF